jgi:hypothetical protein
MTSTFTWLDHSDRDRRRVLDAIDRFKESDTRDELGLSTIRDALADMFFPGTTVLQTRARYFLFVPWIYQQLEAKRVPSDRFGIRARQAETKLIDALKAGGESVGVVGARAGAALKRLASNIYWLGLGSWNIRQFVGGQDDYHGWIDRYYERAAGAARDDDRELIDRRARRNWHADLPDAPDDLLESTAFALSGEEGEYLRERVICSAPGSLLEFLVRRGRATDVAYAWEHPQYAEFPGPVQDALGHARAFAEVMHGAALLYNLMLAEALPEGDARRDLVEDYRERLGAWSRELQARDIPLARWDRNAFWGLVSSKASIRPATRSFVDEWIGLGTWESDRRAAEDPAARALVRKREFAIKGGRARIGNPRALELWNGASGAGRLDYRWPTAGRLTSDIREGLGGKHART